MKIITQKINRHKEMLRQHGLGPVLIWVPDTRRPGFAMECRRQSESLKSDAHEMEVLDFLEQAADREGWEA